VTSSANNLTSLLFGFGGSQIAASCSGATGFIVDGVLGELDEVGEWYHDARAGKIYLGASVGSPASFERTLTLAQYERIITVMGSRSAPVVDLTIQGLVFRHTQAVRLARAYESVSDGDWTFQRTGAILAEGSERLTVTGCRFMSVGSYGVAISRHARGAVVSHNVFDKPGETAIIAVGT